MDHFPLAAPPFQGSCRKVPAGNALDWIKQAWFIFQVKPAAWIAITILFWLILLGLSALPWLGSLLAQVLTPVLIAGCVFASHQAVHEQKVSVSALFHGFYPHTTLHSLILLGLLYLGSFLVLYLLFLLFSALLGGGMLASILLSSPFGAYLTLAVGLVLILCAVTLSIMMSMALWFAPALIVFNQMSALPALIASLNANLKNMPAFCLYGLLLLLLAIIAIVPLGLGLLIFFPLVFGSLYAAYKDIFVAI
ncbi:MAG: BPSS1780 family membrane protein [Pseudomonadota bacterium]